jgi:hypothetical protein
MDTDRFLAKPGEPISASKLWNPLVRALFQRTWKPGRNVRLLKTPGHTVVSYVAHGSTVITHRFQVTAEPGEKSAKVRFEPGWISGIEPVIGSKRLSEKDSADEYPALTVEAKDFENGQSLLYARVTSNNQWEDIGVEMVARAKVPKAEPWTGYKLIAFLIGTVSDFEVVQMVYFNLGHAVLEGKINGACRQHLWYAQ